MEKQLILAVGREFGSGGHEIAEKLAAIYGLPLYDRNLLDTVAKECNLQPEMLKRFDEKPRNLLLSRKERGLSNSPEYNVAHLQFNYMKEKAASGESFVIVGRCAETILKEYEGLISIFVHGDIDKRIERISRTMKVSAKKAEQLVAETDRKRRHYHDSYCELKWGDARNYNIAIDSSVLGIDGTVELLKQYIDRIMQNR
ncbi:MAG: cytidylate kinase-like family protein [Lachnospiraceae bacterium]|nr:cytidylate kinase-like family protein [Lachnospiraceae bacterium]